ncbi:Reverse transcriptase zinc-binding domain [Macleaya cordata]|uniref:Reverse transcriptase zinc-binding domain n=1 Tax=Macleaya cordata TaxID=56857 RepID=A0A200PXM5_MACCD|nr:Reverse transcriptase zinc-binding domain [Macleaya cordata]
MDEEQGQATSEDSINKVNMRMEYLSLVKLEDIQRHQKMKDQWVGEGERNSAFYHGSLRDINTALMCKWLWRFSNEEGAYWRCKMAEKYKVDYNGWDSKIPYQPFGTGLWKGICTNMKAFKEGLTARIGNGRKVKFWSDQWLGENPLKESFKELYKVSRKQNALVADMMQTDGNGRVLWDLDLPRRLSDQEAREFSQLSFLLETYELNGNEDTRLCRGERNGKFSVKSCYEVIHKGGIPNFTEIGIWDQLIPTKISFFIWLVYHNAAPTQDNLAKRGMVVVNRCYLCCADGETVDHLLLHCSFANEIWTSFLAEFGIRWAFQNQVKEVFEEGISSIFAEHGNYLWRLLPYAICWVLWKERNERYFNDKEKGVDKIIMEIKAQLLYWLGPSKKLGGIRFENLLLDWRRIVCKM